VKVRCVECGNVAEISDDKRRIERIVPLTDRPDLGLEAYKHHPGCPLQGTISQIEEAIKQGKVEVIG